MNKRLLISAALAAAVILGSACEGSAERQDRLNAARPDPTTTTTVERARPAEPVTPPERSVSEAERLAQWDGTGDQPFGDDPNNDGRFSDVTCDTGTGQPVNGYTGGLACTYDDGTRAAEGIKYRGDTHIWYWGGNPISDPGQCPDEDDCSIAWSHELTAPIVVGHND